MQELYDSLKLHPVVYITRDIERALGLPLTTEGYFIIANSTPFAKEIAAGHANIILIESTELLDTHELLQNPLTRQLVNSLTNPSLLVFKNTPQIERICQENNWRLLNPSAALAARVEEKISQVEWLSDLAWFLPTHKILPLKEVTFTGRQFITAPFVIQFNRAHTGNGTVLIKTEDELKALQQKFPDRPVRVTKYHEGMMLTSNNVVTDDDVLVGNVSCQITGLAPFTDQPFATVGNDWQLGDGLSSNVWYHSAAGSYLYTEIYWECVKQIGNRLREQGWRGLFGLDFLLQNGTFEPFLTDGPEPGIGNLYLIEINARQPASTTFESLLQRDMKALKHESMKTLNQVTTFEAHLMSLLGLDLGGAELVEVNDGAQIILRNKLPAFAKATAGEAKISADQVASQLKKDFNVVPYSNTKPGSDLLRIQSKHGIMKNYREFNEVGKKIIDQITI